MGTQILSVIEKQKMRSKNLTRTREDGIMQTKEVADLGVFDDFSVFDFSEGVPYLSITRNGVTFNKAVTLKLGKPQYVRLLINAEKKLIAVQVCDEDGEKSVQFYKQNRKDILSVRWNGRDLLNTLRELLGDDLQRHGFRIDGTLLREEHAMLFDLNKAVPLE